LHERYTPPVSSTSNASGKPKASSAGRADAALDRQLSALFQTLLDEPTPPRFLDLINRLEAQSAQPAVEA
jgi:hypothetical protein